MVFLVFIMFVIINKYTINVCNNKHYNKDGNGETTDNIPNHTEAVDKVFKTSITP